jgi:three-Cys-motif partner protein
LEQDTSLCEECTSLDRKEIKSLCDKRKPSDGLAVRCVHGQSAKKLEALKKYLEIFCIAMKSKFRNRIFLDLFSGPGLCYDRNNRIFLNGSSLITLGLSNPFTKHIFVDSDPTTLNILRLRCGKSNPILLSSIEFMNVDSNSHIDEILSKIPKRHSISVVFVDPNGLDIHFETIRKLSAFPSSMDIIIHFSVFDLKRNLGNYKSGNEKADKFFGCHNWPRNSDEWLPFYRKQLANIGFSGIEGDNELIISIKTSTDAPIYHLIYASKHLRGLEFWRKVKKSIELPDLFPY